MENTEQSSSLLSESARFANKWYNDTASSVIDNYNKQLNLAFSFYRSLFDTYTNAFSRRISQTPNFMFGGDTASGAGYNPFAWLVMPSASANPFASLTDNFVKQWNEYSKTAFDNFLTAVQGQQKDIASVQKKYQDFVKRELEILSSSIRVIGEAYDAQISQVSEINRKALEDLNKLFSTAVTSNEQFLSELGMVPLNGKKKSKKEEEFAVV